MSSWLHCDVELAFLRFLFFGVGFCGVSVISEELLLLVVVVELGVGLEASLLLVQFWFA